MMEAHQMYSVKQFGGAIGAATQAVKEGSSSMHVISESDPGKLIERQEQILKTVEYLRDERFGLEQNAPWMDTIAYRRRISLLEALAVWYDEETAEINEALGKSCFPAFGQR
jgi:hypothetical protein